MGAPIDVQRLREEILAWMTPPSGDEGGRVAGRQIRRLAEALEHPSGREDLFLSTVAEAALARRLLECGRTIDIERPTAHGRHGDFHVRRGDVEFWIHVKRVAAPPVAAQAEPPPGELLSLGELAIPVAVAIRWTPGIDAAGLAALRDEVERFVSQASVGDELVVRGESGEWLGAARIAAPSTGGRLALRTGAEAGWEAAIPRVQRLLRKAYSQFMPGAANAVCIASDSADACEAVENALLGTVIERWDAFPPRGRRVAHGRADDGFWSRGQFATSSMVAWFPVDGTSTPRLWRRHAAGPARDEAAADLLREVLGAEEPP